MNLIDIIIGIVLFLGVIALQAMIAQLVCKRMCQQIVQDIANQMTANSARKIQQIEQQQPEEKIRRLVKEEVIRGFQQIEPQIQRFLNQALQKQMARHRTDDQARLLETLTSLQRQVGNLEKRVSSGESPMIDRAPPRMTPAATKWENDTSRQSLTASRSSVDPEEVAFSILDLIEPKGRSSPLARMAGLNDWLKKNYPSLGADPIGALNQDLWRLVVLTADWKTGIVAPALDSIVGPSESLTWFEGGRYDGTQALMRANVAALAQAERDEATQTWQPRLKGKIDLMTWR
jgi:hypothetical protein